MTTHEPLTLTHLSKRLDKVKQKLAAHDAKGTDLIRERDDLINQIDEIIHPSKGD